MPRPEQWPLTTLSRRPARSFKAVSQPGSKCKATKSNGREDLDEELSVKLRELQQFLSSKKRAEAEQVLSAVALLVQTQRDLVVRVRGWHSSWYRKSSPQLSASSVDLARA